MPNNTYDPAALSQFVGRIAEDMVRRNLTPPLRAGVFTSQQMREQYVNVPVPWGHGTQTPSEADQRNCELISRWSVGSLTADEEIGMRCPCIACSRAAYEQAGREVGSAPVGYAEGCACSHCREWRVSMVAAIERLRRDERSWPDAGPIVEVVMDLNIATELAALRRAEDELTFERNRAERGHPLPPQKIAADWRPSFWEA